MFKEDETQYCPMCEEWARKYEQMEQTYKAKIEKAKNRFEALKRKICLGGSEPQHFLNEALKELE